MGFSFPNRAWAFCLDGPRPTLVLWALLATHLPACLPPLTLSQETRLFPNSFTFTVSPLPSQRAFLLSHNFPNSTIFGIKLGFKGILRLFPSRIFSSILFLPLIPPSPPLPPPTADWGKLPTWVSETTTYVRELSLGSSTIFFMIPALTFSLMRGCWTCFNLACTGALVAST